MSVRENLTLGRPDADDDEIARGARAGPGRLRVRPAVGAGHPGRRAGAVPLRRAAAAARAGPGGARPAARCWCWTTRCPRSTCTPRRWSRRRCAGCCATPPRCWWCTGRRRSRWPTGWRCSQDGRITAVGRHSELLATVPAYRALLAAEPPAGHPPPAGASGPSSSASTAGGWCARERAGAGRPTAEEEPELTRWRGTATDPEADRSRAEDTAPEAVTRLRAAQPRPAAPTCCARTGGDSPSAVALLLAQNAAAMAGPYLVMLGIDRAIPPLRAGDAGPLVAVAGRVRGGRGDRVRGPARLPHPLRPDRPGRPARPAAAGVRALPAAVGRLPRALHLRPDGLPAHQRHGLDRRTGRRRHRQTWCWPGCRCCRWPPSCSGWTCRWPPVTLLAFPFLFWLSRWFARSSASAYRRTREAVALVIVHFVESMRRHPGGAGVPPGAAQPADLRGGQRRLPADQPARVPADRHVLARRSS